MENISHNPSRLRLFWTFFKSTWTINLLFPIICATSVPMTWDFIPDILKNESPAMTFWNVLSVCVMTVGPLVSFAYREWARPNEYYFYNNCGISKYQLMAFTMAVSVLLGISILIIKSYVTSS